jgi:hypothetical protein
MNSYSVEQALFNLTGNVEAVRETTVYKLQQEKTQTTNPNNNLSNTQDLKINEPSPTLK